MPFLVWGQNIPEVELENVGYPLPCLADRVCRVPSLRAEIRESLGLWITGMAKVSRAAIKRPVSVIYAELGTPEFWAFLPFLGWALETGAGKLRLTNGRLETSTDNPPIVK